MWIGTDAVAARGFQPTYVDKWRNTQISSNSKTKIIKFSYVTASKFQINNLLYPIFAKHRNPRKPPILPNLTI